MGIERIVFMGLGVLGLLVILNPFNFMTEIHQLILAGIVVIFFIKGVL